MEVNRKILEKKSDVDLEKYLVPESRYVATAMRYAYEILKERGKVFSEDEEKRVLSMIENLEEKEAYYIHPDYKEAAMYFCIPGVIGIILLFVRPEGYAADNYMLDILSIAVQLILAWFTSRGFHFMKYIWIILLITSIPSLIFGINQINFNLIHIVILLGQIAIQVWAIIILFKIPKNYKPLNEESKTIKYVFNLGFFLGLAG